MKLHWDKCPDEVTKKQLEDLTTLYSKLKYEFEQLLKDKKDCVKRNAALSGTFQKRNQEITTLQEQNKQGSKLYQDLQAENRKLKYDLHYKVAGMRNELIEEYNKKLQKDLVYIQGIHNQNEELAAEIKRIKKEIKPTKVRKAA